MGDLISRKAAIDIMQTKGDAALGTPKAVFYSAAHMLELLPAVDAEPVRRGQWISVQERLPGNLEKCLTFSPENGIRIGCYTEVGFILSNFGGDPTHWMPMPEPPKHDVDGDGA